MADAQTTFNFELVSPEKKLIAETAWQVTIPGEEGEFGVRAGHTSLVAAVRPGVIEVISQQGAAPKRIFIAGGFADVTATQCTVLAEEAVNIADLDSAKIQQEIVVMEEKLKVVQDGVEKSRLTRNITTARAKLDAVRPVKAA